MLDKKESCIRHFNENYRKPGHELFSSGINNVYRYYKGILTHKEIKKLLGSVENYTLLREYKRNTRNPSYSHFKRYQIQIDLIDIQSLSRWNDGVKYLLSAIDTFTRKAIVKPCKDKKAGTVLKAFKSILQQFGQYPVTLVADRGAELRNREFISFCKLNKINFFHNFTSVHAAYVERFNRTFQNLIYKYLAEFERKRYIDKLDDFLDSYNNRYHRMINMSPNEAELESNHINVAMAMGKYWSSRSMKIGKITTIYQKGQLVRIALQKTVFHRGYNDQSNYEVFSIYNIKKNLGKPMYFLETFDKKEKIIGGFYEHELTAVNSDIFRVEKVLKTRKRKNIVEHFVKWKGYGDDHNSWIKATDVTKLFDNKEEDD